MLVMCVTVCCNIAYLYIQIIVIMQVFQIQGSLQYPRKDL